MKLQKNIINNMIFVCFFGGIGRERKNISIYESTALRNDLKIFTKKITKFPQLTFGSV